MSRIRPEKFFPGANDGKRRGRTALGEGRRHMLEKVCQRILEHLPLYAAEGGQCGEAEAAELVRLLEPDTDSPQAVVSLIQEIFCKAGLLDTLRASQGAWRFVSYPARLFACSLLALLSQERGLFRSGFWAAGPNEDFVGQHRVLHALETHRCEYDEALPIRRTFVAWGVVRRRGHFILKRRENREDDPDNRLHGNYGFPGGRVNLCDLDACGSDMDLEHRIALLYGVPRPLTDEEKSLIDRALSHTLVRELKEELGLEHKVHYSFSDTPRCRSAATFLHGANAQHCITECRYALYEIALTPKGDARLASGVRDDELFTLDEMLGDGAYPRKAFLHQSDETLLTCLGELPDSASSLRLGAAGLSPSGTKAKGGEGTADIVLPLNPSEPLVVGDCEIPLPDSGSADLLLLLGLTARGVDLQLLSNDVKCGRWGWVQLSQEMLLQMQRLGRAIAQSCGEQIVLIQERLCRLNAEGDKVFFSSGLFSADLREDLFVIRRGALDRLGLFLVDPESRSLSLSGPNRQHLLNLLGDDAGVVSYDTLRKLRCKDNRLLNDCVRELGLRSLYRALDESRSKELQEFRFAIPVRVAR